MYEESLRTPSPHCGINHKAVAKWKTRTPVADLPSGPKDARPTDPGPDKKTMVVVFRRHGPLPPADCPHAVQPMILHLRRSSPHRCLRRYDIGRPPDVDANGPAKKKFKRHLIGQFHIDTAKVQSAERKPHVVIAVHRTSTAAHVAPPPGAAKTARPHAHWRTAPPLTRRHRPLATRQRQCRSSGRSCRFPRLMLTNTAFFPVPGQQAGYAYNSIAFIDRMLTVNSLEGPSE